MDNNVRDRHTKTDQHPPMAQCSTSSSFLSPSTSATCPASMPDQVPPTPVLLGKTAHDPSLIKRAAASTTPRAGAIPDLSERLLRSALVLAASVPLSPHRPKIPLASPLAIPQPRAPSIWCLLSRCLEAAVKLQRLS